MIHISPNASIIIRMHHGLIKADYLNSQIDEMISVNDEFAKEKGKKHTSLSPD